MNITPLGNRVLVKLDKQEETTVSGIVLPTDKRTRQTKGKVTQVSDTVTTVAIGDLVMFSDSAGDVLKLDNDEYVVLDADDILVVIK